MVAFFILAALAAEKGKPKVNILPPRRDGYRGNGTKMTLKKWRALSITLGRSGPMSRAGYAAMTFFFCFPRYFQKANAGATRTIAPPTPPPTPPPMAAAFAEEDACEVADGEEEVVVAATVVEVAPVLCVTGDGVDVVEEVCCHAAYHTLEMGRGHLQSSHPSEPSRYTTCSGAVRGICKESPAITAILRFVDT